MRARRFTLVELLVVVAILTILFSLLVPVVSSALMSARTAACQSNLRQVGLVALYYAEDNRGYAPPYRDNHSGGSPRWYWYVSADHYPGVEGYLNPYNDGLGIGRWSSDPTVAQQYTFVCPSASPTVTGSHWWRENTVGILTSRGYGADGTLRGMSADNGVSAKLSAVVSPGRTAYFGDAYSRFITAYYWTSSTTPADILEYQSNPGNGSGITFRHMKEGDEWVEGLANAVYVDGHVGIVTFEDVLSFPTNRSHDLGRHFWNYKTATHD